MSMTQDKEMLLEVLMRMRVEDQSAPNVHPNHQGFRSYDEVSAELPGWDNERICAALKELMRDSKAELGGMHMSFVRVKTRYFNQCSIT